MVNHNLCFSSSNMDSTKEKLVFVHFDSIECMDGDDYGEVSEIMQQAFEVPI